MLGQRAHYSIYLAAIMILVIGLSTSEFLMSISSITLAVNWVLEGNFKVKFQKLKSDKLALLLTFLFFIYVFWMVGTSDLNEGLKELRIRLPLLLFPIVLGSIPRFREKELTLIARLFVIATLVSTLISVGVYLEWIPTSLDITDVRNISIFISHIRLSLLICVAIVLSIYFILSEKTYRLLISLGILWFIGFLYLIQSATGFVILFILVGFLGVYSLKNTSITWFRYVGFFTSIVVVFGGVMYVWKAKKDYFRVSEKVCNSPLSGTASGDVYFHDMENTQVENNNYIWRNIHYHGLKTAWNERSNVDVKGSDEKGQPVMGTLIRYLTSKGLCKDRDGVESLTNDEIAEIEAGNPSSVELKFGINKRLNEIFWEIDSYINGQNPSGNSVIMRLEFWKTAKALISENILLGVGTGDGKLEMQKMYDKTNSILHQNWRLGSHNEFLSTWVKTGLIGFIIFVVALFSPILRKENRNFIYLSFFLIAILSFLAENTLETQPGVTFFGFFNCWLIFQGFKTSKAH